MSKQLKSTIQLDLDPSGVVKGVAATNRELTKLNRSASRTAGATSMTAGLQVAEMGFNLLRTALGALDSRFSELNSAAQKYSAIAQQAAANATMARFEADVRIGQALGPGAAAVSRGQAEIAAGEALRIESDAERINRSMVGYELAKQNLGVSRDILLEGFGGGIADLMQIAGGDVSGGISSLGGTLMNTLDQLVNPSNYAYAASGSARGMPYDTDLQQQQLNTLKAIEQKLGGK